MIAHDVTREQSERLADAIDDCRMAWEESLDSDKIAEAWLAKVATDYPHANDPHAHSILLTSFQRACSILDSDELGRLGARLGVNPTEVAHQAMWFAARPWIGVAA